MRRITLTPQKKKWANSRPGITLRGLQLSYNASQQKRYERELNKLVKEMTNETKKRIIELFEGKLADNFFDQQKEAAALDEKPKNILPAVVATTTTNNLAKKSNKLLNVLSSKFKYLFDKKSNFLARGMVNDSAKTSQLNLSVSLKQLSGGLTIKTGIIPDGMEDVAQAIIEENVSLISSIPSQYFTDISGAVMRSITTSGGLSTLIPDIQKYSGQTYRRVKNLALDQTRKAYNGINKQRMQAVGVKQFEWVHSGGGQHPRESHIAMNGKIYSFDNLPVINLEQVKRGYEQPVHGIPGQAINCRCTMIPVIKLDSEGS